MDILHQLDNAVKCELEVVYAAPPKTAKEHAKEFLRGLYGDITKIQKLQKLDLSSGHFVNTPRVDAIERLCCFIDFGDGRGVRFKHY